MRCKLDSVSPTRPKTRLGITLLVPDLLERYEMARGGRMIEVQFNRELQRIEATVEIPWPTPSPSSPDHATGT